MENIVLYRGIAVSEDIVDRVVDEIKRNGLSHSKGSLWSGFVWKDLRSDLTRLLEKEDLNRNDTEPNSIWVKTEKGGHREFTEGNIGICFADRQGANYYAFKHNVTDVNTVPIVIEAEVNINNTAIDGRDFLYTVFSFIDHNNPEKTERQKNILSKIYGEKICLYIDKIIRHHNSDKFAVCDLAIIDNDIIRYHLKNTILIMGRWRTRFKGAFYVKSPLSHSSITDILVNQPYYEESKDCISLDDLLER